MTLVNKLIAAVAVTAISLTSFAAQFNPGSGKTLLIVGQTFKDEYQAYETGTGVTPAGSSHYGTLYWGMVEAGDDGPSSRFISYIEDSQPGSYAVVALSFKDNLAAGNFNNTLEGVTAVANGEYDDEIDDIAQLLKRHPDMNFMLRIGYEVSIQYFENPQMYKDAYNRVADRIRNVNGVTNVDFIYHPIRFMNDVQTMYPGDEFVDWVALSVFNNDVCLFANNIPNCPSNRVDHDIANVFDWARDVKGKQIMIAESTAQAPAVNTTEGFVDYLTRLNELVENDDVQALVYINSNWPTHNWDPAFWGDSRVEENPTVKDYWMTNFVNNDRYINYRDIDTTCSGVNEPKADYMAMGEGNINANNGYIFFTLDNNTLANAEQSSMEFSLDGGATYTAIAALPDTSVVTNNLAPGEYNVWMRWGDGSCPTKVDDIVIDKAVFVPCTGNDIPAATFEFTDETSINNEDGTITFFFEDDAINGGVRPKLKFSLDGGNSFTGKVKDKKGKYTLTGVAPGTYDLAIAWHTGECLTDLPDVTIAASDTLICGELAPKVTTTVTPVSSEGAEDGKIEFTFTNDAEFGGEQTRIKFSLDGAKSYPYKAKDKLGSYVVENLPAGKYDLWTAWGDDSCAINLPDVKVKTPAPVIEPCSEGDIPQATIATTDESGLDLNDGVISLAFPNNPNRSKIRFSIDGGNSYGAAIADTAASTQFTGLAPGSYDVWAMWKGDECPTAIATATVSEFVEQPTELVFGLTAEGVVYHKETHHTANFRFLCLNGNCSPASLVDGFWQHGFGNLDPNGSYNLEFKVQDNVVGQCIASLGEVKPGEGSTTSACID